MLVSTGWRSVALACVMACQEPSAVIEDGFTTHAASILGTVRTSSGSPAERITVYVAYPTGSSGFGANTRVGSAGTFSLFIERQDPSRVSSTFSMPVYLMMTELPPEFPAGGRRDSALVNVTFSPTGTPPSQTAVNLVTRWP